MFVHLSNLLTFKVNLIFYLQFTASSENTNIEVQGGITAPLVPPTKKVRKSRWE